MRVLNEVSVISVKSADFNIALIIISHAALQQRDQVLKEV